MTKNNKAFQVRQALGLSPSECGQLILKSSPKSAYDQWTQWESGKRNPSRAAEQLFNMILILKTAKDLKTPGSEKSLDLVVDLLKSNKSKNS